MKKTCFFAFLCSLFILPAVADERCDDFDATLGQFVLRDKGTKYTAYRCVSDGDTNDLENGQAIDFCQNANACLLGTEKAMNAKDHRRLCIDNSVFVKESNSNGKGQNYILSDYSGKQHACYFCPQGYQFDVEDQECENAHSQSCTQLNANKCKSDARYLTEEGGHGCYVCDQKENGSCANGNRVFMRLGYIGNSTELKRNKIWTCNAANKKWTARDIAICPGSVDLSKEYQAGRALAPIVENPDLSTSHNNASSFLVMNAEPCVRWSCDTSKGYKEKNGKCEYDSDYQAYCTENGGEYQQGKCVCKDVLGLVPADNNRTCKCSAGDDFIWDKTNRKCAKSIEAVNRDQNAQRQKQNRHNAAAKARIKCTNSGGTWSGGKCTCSASKNLRLSNGECVCTNENYKRSGDQCVLTDIAQEKKDCEAAASTGAYWQDNECKCENPQHEWRAKKCQLKTDIADCDKITGAHWVNNECKCQNANQEINPERTACVASASFTVSQNINNAYSQLTAIHNTFRDKKSVWKDAEGNFNTARLASDSIAGVVLGTAGGLITSHVVKKNQIENGFEDIKCTIGGQNVAEWGDQFRVGIQ